LRREAEFRGRLVASARWRGAGRAGGRLLGDEPRDGGVRRPGRAAAWPSTSGSASS